MRDPSLPVPSRPSRAGRRRVVVFPTHPSIRPSALFPRPRRRPGRALTRPPSPSPRASSVQVVVRCRPLFGKELKEGRGEIIECDPSRGEIAVRDPKNSASEPRRFTFDQVYDARHSQLEIFEATALPIVRAAMEGYNGTIFAYGQTGTGKTHTMEGKPESASERGIIPNAFNDVFDQIDASSSATDVDATYLVRASYLEIYNEDIRDLLAKDQNRRHELKEHPESGVYVKDLTTFVVKSASEIQNVLNVGKKNRSVGATLMNADSSRSHSIFTITIECSRRRARAAGGSASDRPPGAAADGEDDDAHITVGKLNLVDLAGSERQGKTGSTGIRLKEATKINLSLSTLGNVISSLVDGKSTHVPYRDSKLTRLLEDSLGGNTKTVMVANIGPADYNFEETMSTLRYANRAKNIKNKPRINEDPKDAMLREFQEEIARLKAQLGGGAGAGASARGDAAHDDLDESGELEIVEKTVVVEVDPDADQLEIIKRQVQDELAGKLKSATTQADIDRIHRDAEERTQREMRAIMDDRATTEEEKRRIASEMEAQRLEIESQTEAASREREKKEALQAQIKAIEGKLLHGADDLEARNKQLEEAAAKGVRDIADRERLKLERQRAVAAMEEKALLSDEKFASKKEEVADKTRKLKKMFSKYQTAKQDLEEHADELAREKDDMQESITLLKKTLQLKNALIEHFVPPEVTEKVLKRAVWEDETESWALERLSRDADAASASNASATRNARPVSAAGERRPRTDSSKIAAALGDLNPRHKTQNILALELDLPERTTWDHDGGPLREPGVQAVLDIAFSDDGGRWLALEKDRKGFPRGDRDRDRDGGGGRGGGGKTGGGARREIYSSSRDGGGGVPGLGVGRPRPARPQSASRRR